MQRVFDDAGIGKANSEARGGGKGAAKAAHARQANRAGPCLPLRPPDPRWLGGEAAPGGPRRPRGAAPTPLHPPGAIIAVAGEVRWAGSRAAGGGGCVGGPDRLGALSQPCLSGPASRCSSRTNPVMKAALPPLPLRCAAPLGGAPGGGAGCPGPVGLGEAPLPPRAPACPEAPGRCAGADFCRVPRRRSRSGRAAGGGPRGGGAAAAEKCLSARRMARRRTRSRFSRRCSTSTTRPSLARPAAATASRREGAPI